MKVMVQIFELHKDGLKTSMGFYLMCLARIRLCLLKIKRLARKLRNRHFGVMQKHFKYDVHQKIVNGGLNLNFKRIIYALIMESFVSASVILVSLRTFIFGNGFYDYADQFWTPVLYRIPLFSLLNGGSYIGPLFVGREIVTWPAILLMNLSTSPVVQGKIFTIYTFVIFLAASWILSEMLYRLIDGHLHLNYNLIWKEVLKAFIVIAIYCNIAIMNLNVDGGTFSDGLIMLLIAIAVAYSLLAKNSLRVLAVSASLLSLSIMLDPDYYLGFIAVLFFSFLVNYRYKIWERFALPIASIALSLPAIFYFVKATVITSTGIGNPLAVRSIYFATAYNHFNPFASILLVSNYWSTYAMSAPSILLFINRSVAIPFFGDIVLLPRSFITDIWVLSLALYPLLSFISLAFKGTRKVAVPFVFVWLTAFVLSQWWRIPYLNDLFYRIANIPLVGSAFGTAVSVPDHYLNIMAISEAVLILILVSNVWSSRREVYGFIKKEGYLFIAAMALTFIAASWYTLLGGPLLISIPLYDIFAAIIVAAIIVYLANWLRKRGKAFEGTLNRVRRRARVFRVAVTAIVVFIVLFSGWQAFNGSFFPPRSYNGSSEGILTYQNLAYSPFSPQYIPDYVVNTYNALSSVSSYQTAFIGVVPNNHFGYEDGILYSILNSYYSSALPAFLRTENIKYVITYKNSPQVTDMLNESGLEHKFLGPSSYLYIVNDSLGNVYGANLLLNYSSGNESYIFAYKYLESMNITPVISDVGGNTLGFDTLHNITDILPSSYFIGLLSPKYHLNSSSLLSVPGNITLLPESSTLVRNGWFIYDNSSSTNVTVSGGALQWNAHNGIGLSLNYGNATAPGYYAMIPIKNTMNVLVSANITFQYKASPNFKGNISSDFGYVYYSSGKTYRSYTSPELFQSSQVWRNASYSFSFPQLTGWFSPSVNVSGTSGSVSLRDINVSWGSYRISNASNPYASDLYLGNTTISIPTAGRFYLDLYGNGTFNGEKINSRGGHWVSPSSAETNITGNLSLVGAIYVNSTSIRSLMGSYTVSDNSYSFESRLIEGGHSFKAYYTITGQEVFQAPYSTEAKMVMLGSNFVIYGFIMLFLFIILFPALVFIVPISTRVFSNKERR